MKYSLLKLPILLPLLFLTACKKTNQDIQPNPTGRWEASKDIGGESQGSIFLTGNGNIYDFTSTSFKKFEMGILVDSGDYKLIKENYQDFSYKLVLNNNYTSKYYLKVENNNLIIAWDGLIKYTRLYIRIP
jgi:hypothetical protein